MVLVLLSIKAESPATQIEQHVEFVVGYVEQEAAQGRVDRLRIDRTAYRTRNLVVERLGADLALFELQQHARLPVGIDQRFDLSVSYPAESLDRTLETIVDQHAAQIEHDGPELFHTF